MLGWKVKRKFEVCDDVLLTKCSGRTGTREKGWLSILSLSLPLSLLTPTFLSLPLAGLRSDPASAPGPSSFSYSKVFDRAGSLTYGSLTTASSLSSDVFSSGAGRRGRGSRMSRKRALPSLMSGVLTVLPSQQAGQVAAGGESTRGSTLLTWDPRHAACCTA